MEELLQKARLTIDSTIKAASAELASMNHSIHSHPETAHNEVSAHDTLLSFISSRGIPATPHAYGLPTSLEAHSGQAGRLVIFCAECDALPDIGHAGGNNLVAAASTAAFIGATAALLSLALPGRLRLLATPGSGGKIKLLEAGAFPADVSAVLLSHPTSPGQLVHKGEQFSGMAGYKLVSSHQFRAEFRGRAAHASQAPWQGVNALDAAVAAYTNIGLLRQHMRPEERVHGVIEVGGTVPGVVPDYTRMSWVVCAPGSARLGPLVGRVKACIEAGGAGMGCEVNFLDALTYKNLRPNKTLCKAYAEEMELLVGEKILLEGQVMASSDLGNISHVVPTFQSLFSIATAAHASPHNPLFAEAAGTVEAFDAALKAARGMAMLAVRVLLDDSMAADARGSFKNRES